MSVMQQTEQRTLVELWNSLTEQKPNLRRAFGMLSEKEMTFYEIRKTMGPRVHGTLMELVRLGLIEVKKEEQFEKIKSLTKKTYGLTKLGRWLIENHEKPKVEAKVPAA